MLVRVTTDDGVVGYGEATPLPDWGGDFGGARAKRSATVISLINRGFRARRSAGADPTNVTAARRLMDRLVVGNNYAKCAVDIALHDLWGKSVGLPIYRLLGGAVRDSVPIAHMVGLMHEDHALEEGVAAVADGVQARCRSRAGWITSETSGWCALPPCSGRRRHAAARRQPGLRSREIGER